MQLVLRKPSYKSLNLDLDGQTNGQTNTVSSWGTSCFPRSPRNYPSIFVHIELKVSLGLILKSSILQQWLWNLKLNIQDQLYDFPGNRFKIFTLPFGVYRVKSFDMVNSKNLDFKTMTLKFETQHLGIIIWLSLV